MPPCSTDSGYEPVIQNNFTKTNSFVLFPPWSSQILAEVGTDLHPV